MSKKARLLDRNPMWLKWCPKHHVWLHWKHDLPGMKGTLECLRKSGQKYSPVLVCPLCVKLAKLKINKLISDFRLKRRLKSFKIT